MSEAINETKLGGWYPGMEIPDNKINDHTANGTCADIGELIYRSNQKETILTLEFFLSEILQGMENDKARKGIVRTQIYNNDSNLARNPIWGTLRIDELSFGKEITVFEDNNRNDGEAPTPYESGTIVSEPYFADDDLWWIDVERKDYDGKPDRRPYCLGILGVTMNDNQEWNPYFYVVSAPFEPESVID